MNPQYPQNPQTPGYGTPQQPSQYPGYGAPQQPAYPQTPGYGAPQQPVYPQAPGYGAPQQPSQYPGYGAPPQPSQYPGYGVPQPGYPTPGYGQPPRPRRQMVIIGVIAAVVLLGVIIGLIVRYNGPVSVSKDFVQNIFEFNSANALKDVCTDSSATSTKLRQEVSALGALNTSGQTVTSDISGVTFTTTNESFSTATVTFSGNVTESHNGQSSGPTPTHGTLILNATGLWWCVTDTPA